MQISALKTIKDRFEAHLPGNCLVLPVLNEDKIYDYQVEMIVHNSSPFILPLEKRRINNQIRLYYKTSSLIPLSRYLSGAVIHKDEFLHIIESIVRCLADCKRYFLYECCFLLDIDYIYIKPGTKSVSLIYIPLETEAEPASRLKVLINELVTALDDCSDNMMFYKKITGFFDKDSYDPAEFARLIRDLKYPQIQVATEPFKPVNKPFALDPGDKTPTDLEQTGQDEKKSLWDCNKKYIFSFVLAQIVFLITLTIFYERLKSWGEIASAGIALVLAALNILFLVKLFAKIAQNRNNNKKKEQKDNEWQHLLKNALAIENNIIKEILKKNQIL